MYRKVDQPTIECRDIHPIERCGRSRCLVAIRFVVEQFPEFLFGVFAGVSWPNSNRAFDATMTTYCLYCWRRR